MTQHNLIVEHLAKLRRPVAGYDLEKVVLNGEWVGTRGSRSARDLVDPQTNEGTHKLGDTIYTILRTYKKEKDKKGRTKNYAYYEVVSGEKSVQQVEIREGVARISQIKLLV